MRKIPSFSLGMLLAFASIGQSFAAKRESKNLPSVTPVSLTGGTGGIGFDNILFSPVLKKTLVPGGRSGNLYLVDPVSQKVDVIQGFSSEEYYPGGHGQGITSVDAGAGFIFVTDRSSKRLGVVDPKSQKIVASAPLSSSPDYVKYVSASSEVWVTEPGDDRIEIFTLSLSDKPTVAHSGFISVEGGPESIIYDSKRAQVYTNLWAGQTVAIDLKMRKIAGQWSNGCYGSRCMAIDESRGFLFAGCSEGKASVMDLNHGGKLLSSLNAGAGIDGISYSPALRHLYLPGSKSATLSIVDVSKEGTLQLLEEVKTEKHSHCAASDDSGNVWVCDPDHGQLLFYKDSTQ